MASSASCNHTHAAGDPSSSRTAPCRPCVRQPAAHRHGAGQQQQEVLLRRCHFAGAPLPHAVALLHPRRPSIGEQHEKEPRRASTTSSHAPSAMATRPWSSMSKRGDCSPACSPTLPAWSSASSRPPLHRATSQSNTGLQEQQCHGQPQVAPPLSVASIRSG